MMPTPPNQELLLITLERLLALPLGDVETLLQQVSDLIARALITDKVDVFVLDGTTMTLEAAGTSRTPMGDRQRALGLHRLPLANGGREVEVFETGCSYLCNEVQEDLGVARGTREALGVGSMMAVAWEVEGTRRGVLAVCAAPPGAYHAAHLSFLEAVAHWVGIVTQRAEMVAQLAAGAAERVRQMVAEELIAVLAHDLRSYLTPLVGRIDLLHRHAERDGRARDAADAAHARTAARRLHSLMDDLLDAARLEQGLGGLLLQKVALRGLVQETIALLNSRPDLVTLRMPDEEVWAMVDPSRFQQIVHNLLTNALRYSPPEVPVTVTLTREAHPSGMWAVLTVRDEGAGIDPALLPRLFERFAKGGESSGSGLGLYLAQRLTLAHGGTLSVDAHLESGTQMRLALPLPVEG